MDVNTKRLELRLKEMESRLQKSMEEKKTQIVESRLENMEEKFKTIDQRHMTMNEHVINTQLRMTALSGLVPTYDSLNAIDKRLSIMEQNYTQMEERNKCIEDLDSRISTSLEDISSHFETLELKLKLEAENKVELPPITRKETNIPFNFRKFFDCKYC
jgi:chromosome condensin MukBEF ATPase and DNA-binding subunit MukB